MKNPPFVKANWDNTPGKKYRKRQEIKPHNIGEKITSLEQIYNAAMNKQCLIWCSQNVRTAAAFVLSWQGAQIHRAIQNGMYIYVPEPSKFERMFTEPLEFWTSEDGSLLALVIKRRPDYLEVLKAHYIFTKGEEFDPAQIKEAYVEQEWVGKEHFDGGSGQKRGKVWRVTQTPNEFPVYEYTLKVGH